MTCANKKIEAAASMADAVPVTFEQLEDMGYILYRPQSILGLADPVIIGKRPSAVDGVISAMLTRSLDPETSEAFRYRKNDA